ncbi:hypothetical protein E3N88_14180 [Mikania micrantha]|uniref:PGG domain-containing protein n=1 Tax=Mikania micrantha TaxID=192012 RepID=A0A5N6P0N5_9ASTR|nr:hypothetical protein E3N88_14180 [Mikania micrantha]
MEVEGRHTDEQPINPDNSSKDWPFSYFKFDKERDSPDQVRNTILVVAALVAAASYQAVMSPPNDFKNLTRYTQLIFIYANTLAWSSSITIIAMLTSSFPFQIEIQLSYLSMCFAYGSIAAGQADISFGIGYILLVLCIFAPSLIRLVNNNKLRGR